VDQLTRFVENTVRKLGAASVGITVLLSAMPLAAQDTGDASRGQEYAARICAECHAIAGGGPSPNTSAPPFSAIANTPGMTEAALAVFLFTPHRQMPDLIIPPPNARDLIAYVLQMRRGPSL
jgi:mono/diheme cytochrome c family protein